MRTTLTLAIALTLAFAGCIQNISDLKDRVGGDDTPAQTIEPATIVDPVDDGTNATPEAAKKAPVARISVFGANGALVFKSSFPAEDPAALIFVDEKTTLKVIASDSETLEPGATIASYAWSLDGKPLQSARQANAQIGEAGLYPLVLTIVDSNGKSDTQTVKLAVAPKPYEVTTELMSGPIAGAEGQGQPESLTFTLAADASKGPSVVQKVVIVVSPDITLDIAVAVMDAEGNAVADADDGGVQSFDQTETIELGAVALGDYTITLSPFAGADADGVPVTITVTYLPIIAGLDGGDGHGGHAH